MKIIDLKTIKKETNFTINKNVNYKFYPPVLKNISLKNECLFEFQNSNISSKIIYKCIAQNNTELDLTIRLFTKRKNIQNLNVDLEIYVLNLDEKNTIKVRPYLEISQKEIKFEHKVTIGAPNKKWIQYLNSKGLSYKEALNLITTSFITG